MMRLIKLRNRKFDDYLIHLRITLKKSVKYIIELWCGDWMVYLISTRTSK